jgi:hypothetical protein
LAASVARASAHGRAARLLSERHAPPAGLFASHLLAAAPAADAWVVERLREAIVTVPKRERDGLSADRSVAVPEFVLEVVVAALGCVVSAALLLGGLALAFGLAFQTRALGTDALVCLADDSIQEPLQSRSRARLDLADDDPAASELHLAPSGCARGRWRFDQHHVEDLEEGEVRIRSHPNAQLPLLYLGRTPVDRVAHRLRP